MYYRTALAPGVVEIPADSGSALGRLADAGLGGMRGYREIRLGGLTSNIGALVQARMTSQRLPGKVLMEVAGQPLLAYLLERLDLSRELRQVVVVTSDHPSDDPIAAFCAQSGRACFRGDLVNVAGRCLAALDHYGWDAFVRISGDSPMLDQALVDRAVAIFRQGAFDLVTNVFPRSWPPGQSVEVVGGEVFRKAVAAMDEPRHLEHVTPYFYEHQQQFAIFNMASGMDFTSVRLSVDTKADLAVFARIVGRMDKPHWQYGLAEVVELYRRVTATADSAAPA